MFLSWSERLTRTGFDSPLRSCWSERLRRLEPEASSPRRWCGPGQRPEWRWRGRRYSCRRAAQSWHGPLSRLSPWWKRVRVSRQNFRSGNILGYQLVNYQGSNPTKLFFNRWHIIFQFFAIKLGDFIVNTKTLELNIRKRRINKIKFGRINSWSQSYKTSRINLVPIL